jgi:enoyl-CoA hydratase/carnithine racemase
VLWHTHQAAASIAVAHSHTRAGLNAANVGVLIGSYGFVWVLWYVINRYINEVRP